MPEEYRPRPGQPNGWTPESEADHFMQCPECGCWFDMRDMEIVFKHAGPLPHPNSGREM